MVEYESDTDGTEVENDSESKTGTSTRRSVLRRMGALGAVGLLGEQSSLASGVVRAQEQCQEEKSNVGNVSNRYIIGTDTSIAVTAAQRRASSVNRILDFGSIGQAVVGRFSRQEREALAQHDDVRYIEQDGIVKANAQTLPWGVDRIDADVTNVNGYTGSGAHIAILDTGIDDNHPDIAPNLGAGESFVDYTTSWDDDDSHGTHCAGIAAAVNNTEGVVGVAPSATLHAGKVLGPEGGYASWAADGITWAADQGYDVASMSFGGGFSQVMSDACLYAYSNGVLLVAAAGNDYAGPVNYPAAFSIVIAVSSTTQSDTLSDFSNVGPEIELAAPGSGIYSTVPDFAGYYATYSGTSMACPHVSGVGGLLMSPGGGDFSNTVARKRLQDTAEDIGLSGNEQGFGLVDAEAAVVQSSPGEVGKVTISQQNEGTWYEVSLEGSYEEPVVIMNPVSSNGHQPCHIRIRNVQSNSFQYQIEEWDYLDGGHIEEELSYLVMEAGTYTFDNGTYVEVGQVMNVNDTFENVSFNSPGSFANNPIVLSQAQTFDGPDAIVTRMKSISTSGFDVRVQEEEAKGRHIGERVGYIAIDSGRGRYGAKIFEAGRSSGVTDAWDSTDFTRKYGVSPIFLANMQTFRGPDTAELRYRNLAPDRVEVRVEEEQSSDNETNHTGEEVGYLALRGRGLL